MAALHQTIVCPIIVGCNAHLGMLDRVIDRAESRDDAPHTVILSSDAGSWLR